MPLICPHCSLASIIITLLLFAASAAAAPVQQSGSVLDLKSSQLVAAIGVDSIEKATGPSLFRLQSCSGMTLAVTGTRVSLAADPGRYGNIRVISDNSGLVRLQANASLHYVCLNKAGKPVTRPAKHGARSRLCLFREAKIENQPMSVQFRLADDDSRTLKVRVHRKHRVRHGHGRRHRRRHGRVRSEHSASTREDCRRRFEKVPLTTAAEQHHADAVVQGPEGLSDPRQLLDGLPEFTVGHVQANKRS